MADDTIKIAIEAVDNASATFEKVGDEVDQLGRRGQEAGEGAAKGAQGFESFAGKLVAVQAGVSIAKEAIGGLKQVWDFAKEGAENQRIAESFSRTAQSIGANADDIVAKLDAAAKGTVDDEELMQASTRALTLGVAKSGDDLVNVMKLARAAALQFGGDAGSAFETINQAIGNLAPRALKQFGIIVSLKDANEEYAKTLGVTADSLTEEQQRQALLNAVLEQGAKTFKDVGDQAATTGERMKALETRAANYLDIAKEIAATGIGTALDITDAPKNAMEAFVGTAEKMRKEVAEGRMSVKDYNDGLRGMANTISPLVSGAMADAAFESYKLGDSFEQSTKGAYALNGALDESARAANRAADAQAAEAVRQQQAKDAAQKHTEIMRAYSAQLLANVQRYKETQINLADTTALAITYTEAQQKQSDVQAKLDALNQQIASHGAARAVTVKNEKLSTEDLAKAQLGLAVAQEDLATVQRKANETDAEFALRVETLKGKVADYSQKLGEHTAVVGGATKAELEQKKALEDQIATFQKAGEIEKAKGAFEALTAAFKEGALTEDQYKERATALNTISGLYTQSALDQATAQEVLMKSFADPRSEAWRSQLILNQKELDGVVEKSDAAKKATNDLKEAQANPVKAEAKAAEVETPKKIGAEAYQEQLDARKKLAEADAAQKKSIEDVSVAQETASRQMKGNIDLVAGSYTGVQNAIADTKQRTAEMTADAIKASQDRSSAQEAESRQMKGNIDEVIGEFKKIPEKIPVKVEVVTDIQDKTKTVAGDSIAERANQARNAANDTSKNVQDSAKKTIDAVADIASKTTDKITGVTVAASSKLNTLATSTDNKFGSVSTSVINAMTDMGNIAGREIDDILSKIVALPTYKEFIYQITVKGSLPEGLPGFAQGGSYTVPPNPAGGSGDYFPIAGAPGERITVETPAQQAAHDNGRGSRGDTYNYTTNVYNPLAAAMLADKQRRERLARSNARMGVTV